MNINKLITKVNYTKGKGRDIKYIVIHYVGAEGGAKDNCRYFERFYRGASAHYFVGHGGEVWQCVEDNNIAWHCGALKYKHPACRNANSIGVELCCRKDSAGKWYFEDATIAAAAELVQDLMRQYNISAGNVIRHYDVTGKQCPAPFVLNNTSHTWGDFQRKIGGAPVHKSVDIVAKEAIKGVWGNGTERKKRLAAAGYDYAAVQELVNKMLRQ